MMKRSIAAAALVVASSAHASELTDKVRAYVPVYALAAACDIRVIGAAASGDHRVMLEGTKNDPEAHKLLVTLQNETQAAYRKARDAGNRLTFCEAFIAGNSQYAKARVTAKAELYATISKPVRNAMAHGICKQGDAVKLSKADRNEYETIQLAFKSEQKIAKEDAERNGWNVTDEVNEVAKLFCAGVNK